MVNYQNSKIYRIIVNIEAVYEIYVGSTTEENLCDRMKIHRSNYRRWKDGKAGKCMSFDLFEKYGLENCKIILIEDFPCENRQQLIAREQYHIDRNPNCCNKQRASTGIGYLYKENPQEYNTEYKEKFREKINEKITCNCGGKYTRNGKSQHFKTKKHREAFPQDYLKSIENSNPIV